MALAAALAVALMSAAPAVASGGAPGQASPALPVSIAITSVSPTFATPKSVVTVSGTVTNATSTAAPGLMVQLFSSSSQLANRDAMSSYLAAAPGATSADSAVPKSVQTLNSVPAHTTQRWSLALHVSQVGMTSFGVYPLAAQLYQFGTPVDADRTFLPFWPARSQARAVRPVTLAWLWPLIDVPHQTACPALLNNNLAGSLASGGRLHQLLTVGSSAVGRSADLTWAIDPALLNDAKTMTARYRVGGSATCAGGSTHPASASAQSWLAGVKSVTARQDFFTTPYADVDAAALSHHGLNTQLADAFADGRTEAQAILGHAQQLSAPPAATGPLAWPANGIADYGVLESLAAPPNQIGTVILSSSMMRPAPPASFTPTAVTTTPNGLGGHLHVLLADDGIQQILAAPTGGIPGTTAGGSQSSPAAAAFAREQWFLAETAMIAAEAPHTARAVVVAPPRHWNPGAGLASTLLQQTVGTPWLRPASLSSLITARQQAGAQVPRQAPPQLHVSQSELKASLLRQVQRVDGRIQLLKSILVHPGPRYLSTAMAAVQSSAWSRLPGGRRTARQLLHGIAAYVATQQHRVSIVKSLHVTLGGKSGEVPVSISNHLGQAVRVRLRVSVPSAGRVRIEIPTSPVTVAGGTQRVIRIPVRAAEAGSTTLTLWLATPGGRSLPGSTASLTVEATHFGTMAIVIIGIALAVFVLTAAGRAIRRGRNHPREDPSADGTAEGAGGTADSAGRTAGMAEAGLTGTGPAYAEPEADTVEPEEAPRSPAAKEPDKHASTPGWAERR